MKHGTAWHGSAAVSCRVVPPCPGIGPGTALEAVGVPCRASAQGGGVGTDGAAA